ncbi:MAG: twin-arginine translocase subunit TatC [Opitutales bacterium]
MNESLETAKPEGAMPFLDHVEELRRVALRCAGFLLCGIVIVGAFFPFFADVLSWPLKQAMGGHPELMQGLVTTSPMGVFSVLLQVCFLGGLSISLPFMLYAMGRFVMPGLKRQERLVLIPLSAGIFSLFLIGALFSYFLILPASLAFSISLNQLFGFELIWSAPHYYGLVVWMTLGIGLCFEFPLIIIALIYMRVLSVEKLRAIRRHMVVVILITAALITPGGDPFTLSLLALPMYLLYEAAILIGQRIEAKHLRELDQA